METTIKVKIKVLKEPISHYCDPTCKFFNFCSSDESECIAYNKLLGSVEDGYLRCQECLQNEIKELK